MNQNVVVDAHTIIETWKNIEDNKYGYGKQLSTLFEYDNITDILINSYKDIWVDMGRGLEKSDLCFENDRQVRTLALRLAGLCGKRFDNATPIVDAVLPNGVRMHAVLSPISTAHTLISLRCPAKKKITLQQFLGASTFAVPLSVLLNRILEQRLNVFVSGATGSGKTTLLSALIEQISHQQRIICIEEVSELQPNHPHFVSLQERVANVQNAGAVEMSELVRAAMRMRPDRIVLGECRGAEVSQVLSAMNTGHEGSLATVHANCVDNVPARLIALGSLANISATSMTAQIIAGIDLFIHVAKYRKNNNVIVRYIKEIGVSHETNGQICCENVLKFVSPNSVVLGVAWQSFSEKLGLDEQLFGRQQCTILQCCA